MIKQPQRQTVFVTKQDLKARNILIISGSGDEALYYQAAIGPRLGPSSLMVYFHARSRFLERVRLFGSIKVVVQLVGLGEFFGELKLIPQTLTESSAENHALELTMDELTTLDYPQDQCIVLMT